MISWHRGRVGNLIPYMINIATVPENKDNTQKHGDVCHWKLWTCHEVPSQNISRQVPIIFLQLQVWGIWENTPLLNSPPIWVEFPRTMKFGSAKSSFRHTSSHEKVASFFRRSTRHCFTQTYLEIPSECSLILSPLFWNEMRFRKNCVQLVSKKLLPHKIWWLTVIYVSRRFPKKIRKKIWPKITSIRNPLGYTQVLRFSRLQAPYIFQVPLGVTTQGGAIEKMLHPADAPSWGLSRMFVFFVVR